MGLSGGIVHMKASYSSDGNHVDVQIGGNHYGGNGLAGEMAQYGAVLYSSQWVGWVPGSCGGDGNLQASSFSVSNLKITGKVVQGPEPHRCTPLTPAPTPLAPQTCPGGSMSVCLQLCPGDAGGYKACSAECARRCESELIV